jgi:hypothetical protein
LDQELSRALDKRVRVRFGRSRTRPVEMVGANGLVQLRLHRIFENAPLQVREDLAAWLRVGRRARRACERLDRWIDEQLASLPPATERRPRAIAQGDHFDLAALAAPLWGNEFRDEFEDPVTRPALSWGRRGRVRARHSLQLGSYTPDHHLVRIHRVLDSASVPDWFVRFLLFHELLHAAVPCPIRPDGHRRHHGPEFRAREQAHPDFGRARVWQQDNLPRLIRAARMRRS